MIKRILAAAAVLGCLIHFSGPVLAGVEETKGRMIARIPAIEALKAGGVVGEDNAGFLQFRGPAREQEDLVRAENEDRRFLYGEIARREKVTLELVGRRRALQIAERADPGHWLQDPSGAWYRK